MPSALITGANRRIGLEFARQYLADGWQVMLLVEIEILLLGCADWLMEAVTN